MYWTYSFVLALGMIAALPFWVYQALKTRRYTESVMQRLSLRLPTHSSSRRPIWVHAVSVGEVLAAKALFAALRRERPEVPLLVSTVTLTGQALANRELNGAAAIFYFPFDWDFCVERLLRRLRPALVVIMETELWPNFLRGCARWNIPVVMANARISDKSVRRYRLIPRLARAMTGSLAWIGAQTEGDRERFLAMGAQQEKVVVTGNLKFDLPVQPVDESSELLRLIREALGLGGMNPVVVIGSTMKGEEKPLLEQFMHVRTRFPAAKLILAPRHPERFAEVASLLSAAGIPWARRTDLNDGRQGSADILLLDTIGELRAVYSLATVAVIGGSFLPYGGHNLLEPAALGKAVVFGPEMANFRELAAMFLKEKGARQCTLKTLGATLNDLLRDASAIGQLGRRAAHAYRMNQGATRNTMNFLLPYID